MSSDETSWLTKQAGAFRRRRRLLPVGLMKPVNLAAQLAAAETELTCLKMALAQVKEDRNELRQARDDWRREAEKLYAEKLIDAKLAKLRQADERALRSPERPSGRAFGGEGRRRP